MRLRRFIVTNFKAVRHLEIDWDDLLILLGENNCGKSCVLSALSIFLSGSATKDPLLFHRHLTDEPHAIELIGYFDHLTTDELNQAAVKGRTYNGEWILKKKYWLEVESVDSEDKSSWKEMLFSYSGPEVFAGWPTSDATWAAFGTDYQPLIALIPGATGRTNAGARERLKELVRDHRPDLITYGNAAWIANPGGGGNWKSNANSILPRCIFIRAVQEATEESLSKDASTYGKLVNLIVENQLSERQEVIDLKQAMQRVLDLFCLDPNHPENQAQEIKNLEAKINEGLREVIGGEARIRTEAPDVNSMLLPNTSLVVRDGNFGIDTKVAHQGHGLQRTLVMTLLQLLADAQESAVRVLADRRPVILIIEEPELYMHPQMERRMRDLLYRLAAQPSFQIACCTHSPVFVDIANRHKAIVRMTKARNGDVSAKQVTTEIFVGPVDDVERQVLTAVSTFDPGVNELFFAPEVVLLEELSALAAFERAAELTGLFVRHPLKRRGVSIIDANGKASIPAFQKVLNAFDIPYRVLHDEDRSKPDQAVKNARIMAQAGNVPAARPIHLLSPECLEDVLGYQPPSKGKPFAAVRRVEELVAQNALPIAFIEAMNFVYFGTLLEPQPS
jgi:putative ATP-dependent endonuclease of OLD family